MGDGKSVGTGNSLAQKEMISFEISDHIQIHIPYVYIDNIYIYIYTYSMYIYNSYSVCIYNIQIPYIYIYIYNVNTMCTKTDHWTPVTVLLASFCELVLFLRDMKD